MNEKTTVNIFFHGFLHCFLTSNFFEFRKKILENHTYTDYDKAHAFDSPLLIMTYMQGMRVLHLFHGPDPFFASFSYLR